MKKLYFHDFLAKFPPIPMPVTLGEDTHHTFSTENDPLSDAMILQFIHPIEEVAADDEEFDQLRQHPRFIELTHDSTDTTATDS